MASTNRTGLPEGSFAWLKCDCHKKHEEELSESEHPIRAYDPSCNGLYNGEISDIIEPCPVCNENRMRVVTPGRRRGFDTSALAVFTDGACRNNGRHDAQASIGVFFGPGADRNFSSTLDDSFPATNQAAEILAAIAAIEMTTEYYSEKKICKLLIVTDSEYVVKGISDWIWKWKTNGWRTAKGEPVVNKELFQRLDGVVSDIEAKGSEVRFWHVRRELNRDADRLANEALDSN